jgi:hypothetical protein
MSETRERTEPVNGHGWVIPNPSGLKARCGGPALCPECAQEAATQGIPTGANRHPVRPWPDPTPAMLDSPQFEAIWQCIKSWDIAVPDVYTGHCGATGNHVRAILDALGWQEPIP